MASLVPGYAYDIFISYRQKDNKGDKWVSEFVEALKTELESTFKEEISIYFDINPHDGLLETHDVDASLKEKLKCLVFIPIISRTYCDPKSFAWEHEFKAFVELASQDQFGLKIKLPNGNVASRILPVRIHDLDNEDIKVCESVLGGALRGIEFIYREPGVNKPLAPEDDEKKNLNVTKYRIQVNKVANAIKDIISGLKNKGVRSQDDTSVKKAGQNEQGSRSTVSARKVWKILIPLLLIFVLPLCVWLTVRLVNNAQSPVKTANKSVAVLPFVNLSADKEDEYFSDGITDDILTQLSKIADLSVISRTSVMRYKGTNKSIREIGRELNVATILEGSVRRADNHVRIVAQLIDVRNDRHLWAETYDEEVIQVLAIQSDVAKKIAAALQAELTPEEKERIDKRQTANLTAYEYYLRGRNFYYRYRKEDNETAITFFKKALSLDTDYALAWAGLGDAYAMRVYLFGFPTLWTDSAIISSNRAIALDPASAEGYKALGTAIMDLNVTKGLEAYLKAIELNPNYHPAFYNLGVLYQWKGELIESIRCYEKSLMLDPGFADPYANLGDVYRLLEESERAEQYLKKSIELRPDNSEGHYFLALFYLGEGNIKLAAEQISLMLNLYTNSSDIYNISYAGHIAELTGNLSMAKEIYQKAFEDIERIHDVALTHTRILIGLGRILLNEGRQDEADRLLENALKASFKQIEPGTGYGFSYYNIASVYAVRNKKDDAFSWLQKAIDHGWRDNTIMRNDPCFENLRHDNRFRQMTEQIRTNVTEMRIQLKEIKDE